MLMLTFARGKKKKNPTLGAEIFGSVSLRIVSLFLQIPRKASSKKMLGGRSDSGLHNFQIDYMDHRII